MPTSRPKLFVLNKCKDVVYIFTSRRRNTDASKHGGGGRLRTGDRRLMRPELYQLSYAAKLVPRG